MPTNPPEYRSPGVPLFLPSIRRLSEDEKCWSLYERDEFTADFKRVRRIQTIRVIRDGRLVEFANDLGPASSFKAGPFTVMCLLEDSVGYALEYAHFMRNDGDKGLEQAMADHLGEINVIEAAALRAEQVRTHLARNTRTLKRSRKK